MFSNQALADWTDLSPEQLHGAKCLYSPDDDVASWTRRLAVPPQTKELGEFSTTVYWQRNNGSVSTRRAHFFALEDASESTLVLLDDADWEDSRTSPFDVAALHHQAVEMRREWSRVFRLDTVVGGSSAMQQVRAQIKLAAATDCRVVVAGNEGAGRETIARTIHQERSQGAQALIPLSCALLDAELLQATIETVIQQMAELDNEDGSVLLLLDVGKLSMEAQSALLGFLAISEIGLETMATSSSRLVELVEQGQFRPELAHHLSTLEICIPPLRDRVEDIPLLAQWMLEQSTGKERIGGFTEQAQQALLRYPWPREVGELREVVEAAARAATTSTIGVDDLPPQIGLALDVAAMPDRKEEKIALDAFLTEVEVEVISRALQVAKGNRAQAARGLGISRAKLLRRIEQLGLEA